MKMYLAGPITGESYAGCTSWRDYVTEQLKDVVECLSPMRAKTYLEGHENLFKAYSGTDWFKRAMSGPRGIMSRDYWDCQRCDLLFVNFAGAKQVSIGTCMEIAWCYTKKPIVCVMDDIHDHAMIMEAVTHPMSDIDHAIQVVRALL